MHSKKSLPLLHSAILTWYKQEKRSLPWRKSKDPYRIWISEIMLQQTRVEAVIPYYERFLSHFPTVSDLAQADADKLMNLWAGLGYYSRARNLKAAAETIVAKHNGIMPSSVEELRALKGIGPYTAAAIASIAFNKPYAAIDGNLERVFSRLMALKKNPKLEGKTEIEQFGRSLVQFGKAGDLNQAFMDLSAKICLPKEPKCNICPVEKFCLAKKEGVQREIPKKKERQAAILLQARGIIWIAEEKILLAKRPVKSWLAGMWDIPWWIDENNFSIKQGKTFSECAQIRTITKHKISFKVSGVLSEKIPKKNIWETLPAPAQEFRWVSLEDLHGWNLPRPSEKALALTLRELR